jgi:hypothetical protein
MNKKIMNKETFVKYFIIDTYNLEEFDLDSFKGDIAHSLCLILKFKDKSNEVFIYKLDFESSDNNEEYLEGVYLLLKSSIYSLDFNKRSTVESIELRYTTFTSD